MTDTDDVPSLLRSGAHDCDVAADTLRQADIPFARTSANICRELAKTTRKMAVLIELHV